MEQDRKKVLRIGLLGSSAIFLVFAALLFTRALPLQLDGELAGLHTQDALGALCVASAVFDLVVMNVLLRRS